LIPTSAGVENVEICVRDATTSLLPTTAPLTSAGPGRVDAYVSWLNALNPSATESVPMGPSAAASAVAARMAGSCDVSRSVGVSPGRVRTRGAVTSAFLTWAAVGSSFAFGSEATSIVVPRTSIVSASTGPSAEAPTGSAPAIRTAITAERATTARHERRLARAIRPEAKESPLTLHTPTRMKVDGGSNCRPIYQHEPPAHHRSNAVAVISRCPAATVLVIRKTRWLCND
jgi:hypothetical protein